MKTIEGLACSICSKAIPERKPYSLTTGYARGLNDEKICYECCAENETKERYAFMDRREEKS